MQVSSFLKMWHFKSSLFTNSNNSEFVCLKYDSVEAKKIGKVGDTEGEMESRRI